MAKRLDYDRVRRPHAPTPPPTRMATQKQMYLWRQLAAELDMPEPPSDATLIDAMRNIDRLLRLKHPEQQHTARRT